MNCPDCELHWQRLLDGDDCPATPDLATHLAGCPECRDRRVAALVLLHGLRTYPQPTPAPALNQRILTSVLADRRERLTGRRRLALLAAAAAFLLAPFLGTYWLARPEPPPAPRELVKQKMLPVPVVKAQAEPKTPPLRPQLEESQLALKKFVERFTQSALQPQQVLESVSLPMQLIALDNLVSMEPLSQPLVQATPGFRHAKRGFALGTQSVTGTTRRALSYFSRSLPPLSALPKPPL